MHKREEETQAQLSKVSRYCNMLMVQYNAAVKQMQCLPPSLS